MNPLIEKMVRMYGEPNSPDPEFAIAEMEKSIAGFGPRALDEAWPKIKAFPKKSKFPSVDIIISCCNQAANELAANERRNPHSKMSQRDIDWSNEAKDCANRLINSDLGRKAADEHWIGFLWDHCRKTRRLPTPSEQMNMKAKLREWDESHDAAMEQHGKRWGKVGKEFARGADARRKYLSNIAYGW
jgi:hypothetical protein